MKRWAIAIAVVFVAALALYAQAESGIDTYSAPASKFTDAINPNVFHNVHKISIHKNHKHNNAEKAKQKATLTGEEQVKETGDAAPAYYVTTINNPAGGYGIQADSTSVFKEKANLTILKTRK